MKVLVTGAAGRVGANVVKQLVEADVSVKAMVMPGDPHATKLIRFASTEVVEADLRDQARLDAACHDVTHVVHLAAYMLPHGDPELFYEVNGMGTFRLLQAAVKSKFRLERFVLASSDGTYRPGAPPAVPLTEDVVQEPADYYGTSKLLGEVILRNHAAQFDIPFSIVRFATVVSPDEAGNFFRLRMLRALLGLQALGRTTNLWPLFRGQPKLVDILDEAVGDAAGDTAVGFVDPDGAPWTLSMVDVRDAAQGVCRALTERRALGRAFNIAAAQPTSYEDGAAAIAEQFGIPKRIVAMPLSWRLELSIATARELIGYAPRYDFRSTLAAGRTGEALADEDAFIAAESTSGASALQGRA